MPTGQMFIIPRRNDLVGMNFYITDLFPNTSQRGFYDPEGQTHYVRYSLDFPGTTNLALGAYSSGSLNTSPIADAVVEDTTGGGNDVFATPSTTYGLAGYLRERVQPGGTAAPLAGRMTAANAVLQAAAIQSAANSGSALTLAAINAILVNVGVGGTANTDLDGAASSSFGSVLDILRILAGETYRTPEFTIVCNQLNQFRSLAERTTLVAGQNTTVTGQNFVSQGYFVGPTEPGYRLLPTYIESGYFHVSVAAGYLAAHKNPVTFRNPVFAYTAAAVTPFLPRAYALDGTAIPSSGTYPVLVVYDAQGNVL
jgi:hypothetical protein